MKSPNKLVAPLLVGMLTVGSVHPIGWFDVARAQEALGYLAGAVSGVASAKALGNVAETVSEVAKAQCAQALGNVVGTVSSVASAQALENVAGTVSGAAGMEALGKVAGTVSGAAGMEAAKNIAQSIPEVAKAQAAVSLTGRFLSTCSGTVNLYHKVAGSDAAKKTSNTMYRLCGNMRTNPVKTVAALALVGSVTLGCIAYKYRRESLYDLCDWCSSCIEAAVGYVYTRTHDEQGGV